MDDLSITQTRLEFIQYAHEILEIMEVATTNTDIEAELMLNALSIVVETSSYTADNLRKLLGCIYMAQGIIQHLRLLSPSEILQQAEEVL